MPSLGGITAWISIGETRLNEYGVDVEDDLIKCYVEVPPAAVPAPPVPGSPTTSVSPPPLSRSHSAQPQSPAALPLEYTINWKIQDLTYTMVAVVRVHSLLYLQIRSSCDSRRTLTVSSKSRRYISEEGQLLPPRTRSTSTQCPSPTTGPSVASSVSKNCARPRVRHFRKSLWARFGCRCIAPGARI